MDEDYSRIHAFLQAIAAQGVRHACISPGSRSTPLALTIARHPDIRHWIHHDERSSAFFALGHGKVANSPALVVTTSGTAAAELFPAVIEARFGRVPLIILTADRPPELRGTGSNQTIDQVDLYGSNAKLFVDLPIDATPAHAAGVATAAISKARESPRGPVHINFPFREPLIPDNDESPGRDIREADRLELSVPASVGTAVDHILRAVAGKDAVWVAGPDPHPTFGRMVGSLAAVTNQPVLADALSNARGFPGVIRFGDALAQAGALDDFNPDVIVRLGPVPTSKAVSRWIESRSADYIIVDAPGYDDPLGRASRVFAAEAAAVAGQIAGTRPSPGGAGRIDQWTEIDEAAGKAIATTLQTEPFPSEPAVMAAAAESGADTLWVASSMPVRDLDLVLGSHGPRRVLANRGASGTDGFISSALGSTADAGLPTLAVAGDLSLLHDLTALGAARRHRLPLTVLVINNDGGGIFHLLPQRDLPEFEELFATPHGLTFGSAAELFGIEYLHPGSSSELKQALSGDFTRPRLIEVKSDRHQVVPTRARIISAVKQAVR